MLEDFKQKRQMPGAVGNYKLLNCRLKTALQEEQLAYKVSFRQDITMQIEHMWKYNARNKTLAI